MASNRATAPRRIQICLFLIELSLAIVMAVSAYTLLKFLPFSTSWTAGIFSSLVGLWIIKSTIWALQSLKNRSVYEDSNRNDDLVYGEENEGLKLFESRQESRMKSCSENQPRENHVTFEGGKKGDDQGFDIPTPSKEITDTKTFLMDRGKNEYTSKISFPLLAVLVTALLHCAVRLLVIVQNVRRHFRFWRGRSVRGGLIQFSAIPLTIGRSMSSSGCSFHIFSFLNGWLECDGDGDDYSHDDSHDAPTDNNMSLQAVSINRISINSSHFVMNPPRKHPAARSKLSWLGITFEDIDMSLTIFLKRKGRRIGLGPTEKGEPLKNACIQSMTIRLRMRTLEIGVFPCPLDRCKGIGIQIDANAAIVDQSTDSGKQSIFSGFGVSVVLSQLDMHHFTYLASSEEARANSQDKVISWDKIQSSFHLLSHSEEQSKRDTASCFTFPSGFVVGSHDYPESYATTKSSSTPPLSKRVYINFGDFLCENRFGLGVDLKYMQTFIQSTELLLQNMSSSMISGPLKTDSYTSNNETKKTSSIKFVKLDAVVNIQVYTLLPTAHGTKNAAILDYFSFGATRSVLHWTNDVQSVLDAELTQITGNIERKCDVLNPMLVVDATNASLRHEVFSGGHLDDSIVTALDLIIFNRIKSKLVGNHGSMTGGSKCAIIDLGGIVARADGEVVNKLACLKSASENTRLAAVNFQRSAKKLTKRNSNAGQNKKRDMLSQIEVSCDSVDVIIELLELCENTGACPQGDITNDTRVLVAGSFGGASATILRNEGISMDRTNSDLHLPNQLFDFEVQKCAQHYLIEATAVNVQGSLTFSPHSSLPVVDAKSPDTSPDASRRNPETSFYGKVAKLTFRSAIPLNNSRINSGTRPSFLSKATSATFGDLNIYERFGKRGEMKQSLFSIPVHEFPFCPSFSEAHHNSELMQTYARFTSADLVKIVQCDCTFCLVEKRNYATGEKTETISIQFTSDLEIIWSPMFQWILVSCNNRIQHALARLKALASVAPEVRKLSSHMTNIHIEVDSNVTANIYVFVGVKSLVRTIIDGSSVMKISMAKYPSPFNTSLKPMPKPNISFHAKHMKVLLNNITSPIFTFEDFSVHNFFRRADDNEINEYMSKKENSSDVYANDFVTDQGGHPLKEILELNLGSHVTAKFPPVLHLGEVIDDIVLLPKALNAGLIRLKGGNKKAAKKYQLMSIKCNIPFLDISLMVNDPDAEHSMPTKQSTLFCICFETAEVSIERNAPPDWTQSQLNALDEDNSSTYLYGPAVQGGLVCLTIQHLFCTLHPLNLATPLVQINNFAINGYLYLAGLSPDTPGIQEGKAKSFLLLCHHNSLKVRCASSTDNHRQCCCCYGVSLHSAGIPVKLYADAQVLCGKIDISYGPIMKQSMPRFMECIKRILPPAPEVERSTMPLSWWDNLRFFVHGSISMSADELSFRWLLDSQTYSDLSLIFDCQNFKFKHTAGFFGINASDINFSLPGVAYDMSIHPSARDTKPTFHLPHAAESVVTRGRHQLIYVPSFKTEIIFVWNMLQPGTLSSGHHCIYLNREKEPNNSNKDDPVSLDKFAPFRSAWVNAEFDLELMGSDVCDNWVALRIDVLPWFTHLNSTMTYSSKTDEDEPDPLPKLQRAAIKVITSKLRVATWFEDGEDLASLCLIVKRANYNATADGSKDIVIEGPIKAALLDVSEFKRKCNAGGDHQESDIMDMEHTASEFGTAQSQNDSEANEHSSQADSVPHKDVESNPFLKLQQLSCNIEELDYVVVTGQIDIRNQSLARILAGYEDTTTPKTSNRNLERAESQHLTGVDRTTWSILVSRLRLLWTIEIRDSLMAISKDLIYTIGFMKSQHRQLQVLSENTNHQDHSARSSRDTSFSLAGAGFELSLPDVKENDRTLHDSMLEYLLQESSDTESFDGDLATVPNTNQGDDSAATSHLGEKEKKGGKTLPTLDIQFANPQVQLHSIATGGSIILAMEGAHVEGRKFIHFFVANQSKAAKVSFSDLLRKTEHTYTLTNMEAFSLSTHVDVNIGLPWLEVCSSVGPPNHQTVALEERFGINACTDAETRSSKDGDATALNYEERHSQHMGNEHNDSTSSPKYPSYLCHHEPLAFEKSGLLCPILDQFTFQSKQLFHRPPIHYSTEELVHFVQQELVVCQDEAAVDDIELQIDLLNFNLDSYQFKTTLDVIRNVLLEPPKPHHRHQKFDQDETKDAPKSAGRVSSVAAIEMEDILRNENKRVGKRGRQVLRFAAMDLLRDLEDRIALDGTEVFRRVSYTLSKLTWCIQSQDELDDVQIAFTGFSGQHDYSRDGSIVSQFSLEDLGVSSSKPGPDSIGFPDPTSVVKSVLDNERSPCQRCGQHFDHCENDLNSCAFHLGQFKSGVWTCCNLTCATAPGCKSGPHTGKERAAVVRVETLPRIVDGISFYTHFEVNLFPGILHTLVVQISKSMSRLFMSYFFLGDEDEDDLDDDISTFSDVAGSTDATGMHSNYSPKPPSQKKPSVGNPRILEEFCESTEFDSMPEFNLPKEETKEAEIAFIKVLRVGYVDVNVSLGGFKRLPQTSLDISVPAYSKAYKIGTWEYLSRKYLTYLVHEVVKSGASSGLDKFRRKVMGSHSPGQRSDQLESRILGTSYPRSLPFMPTISDSGPVDLESFIGRHLRRPMGAADILGTPAKNLSKKKKKISFKCR